MDFQLIALVALVVTVMFLSVRMNSKWMARPGGYQRLFSVTAAGLLFFVAGLIGWDLSYSHGWFQGTKWVDGPVWWEVGLGLGLLLLAGFWVRGRLRSPQVQESHTVQSDERCTSTSGIQRVVRIHSEVDSLVVIGNGNRRAFSFLRRVRVFQ
jgi:hypothetical protein